MSTPFKMKGFPAHAGVSPAKQKEKADYREAQKYVKKK